MPQFDVSTFSSQLFWLILVFALLYIIISKIIAPKFESILTRRSNYLEDNIIAAEEFNSKAMLLKEQKELKLRELDIEVENLRKQAMDTLNAIFDDKEKKLSARLLQKETEMLAEMQKYAVSFTQSKDAAALDLSAFIIERITAKPADLKLLKRLHEAK